MEPGGLDQHDDKDDRGEGNAHAHGLFGGVAAGVLALADKDRQVVERQDVVDVDGREDDGTKRFRKSALARFQMSFRFLTISVIREIT